MTVGAVRYSYVCFALIGWSLAVGRRYWHIGGDCWRGKSQCTRRTQNRFMHDVSFVGCLFIAHEANAEIGC